MTIRIEHSPRFEALAPAVDAARAVATAAAVELAPVGGSRSTGTGRSGAPGAASSPHTAALAGAFAGDPAALIATITSRVRDLNTARGEGAATTKLEEGRAAEEARREAIERARQAAEEASGLLRDWGFLGDVVKVAGVVAAVAASVATAGTATVAIVAVAGALMTSFADDIAQGMVDAGIIPQEAANEVALGLKIVGAAMSGLNVSSLASAGSAMTQYAGETMSEQGVDGRLVAAVQLAGIAGGVVGGLLRGGAGTGAGFDAPGGLHVAQQIARHVGPAALIAAGAARTIDAGVGIAAADLHEDAAHARADGAARAADGDRIQGELDEEIDRLRDALQSYARQLRCLQQINTIQNETRQAAIGTRA